MSHNNLPLQAGALTPWCQQWCQRRALDGHQTVPQLNGVLASAVLHWGGRPPLIGPTQQQLIAHAYAAAQGRRSREGLKWNAWDVLAEAITDAARPVEITLTGSQLRDAARSDRARTHWRDQEGKWAGTPGAALPALPEVPSPARES